jgi:hypothetical protein
MDLPWICGERDDVWVLKVDFAYGEVEHDLGHAIPDLGVSIAY